ncbi:helix-turn-helix domain-containing protein [Nostoc sp.]
MQRQAVKIRLYPTSEQVLVLAQHFGREASALRGWRSL